ncbi:MAG: TetR/AcrR family transcriptional regulator, partial [Dehalococcoidia bacterium]
RTIDQAAGADEQITALALTVLDGMRRQPLLNRLLATDPETVLPLLTVDAGPVLMLGRDYVAEFRRLQGEGKLPYYNAGYVAELVARLVLSLALTPQTGLPIDEQDRVRRRFVAEYLVGMFHPAMDGTP